MVSLGYGRTTGFAVDPVEKKPLNHFLPGSSVLSFGTAGCNLGCKFCQNWDISKARLDDKRSAEVSPGDVIDLAIAQRCPSIAMTYNDPIIWAEFAIDIAKEARRRGIRSVLVTAGYVTAEARPELFSDIDAANVDLKAFADDFYHKVTFSHLAPVLETLQWIKRETKVWLEITNLMIPEENDSPEEIERMCDWIVTNIGDQVPIHFTAFHPDFKLDYRPPTPHETLIRAREQAIKAGIKYAYVGNVYDLDRESTYCPGCGECVIQRDWYQLGSYKIKDGKCDKCGFAIAGVFDGAKGNWGRKRVAVTFEKENSN